MLREIETVLAALEREGVRYLVVGGIAVVLHGRLRTTADLDLVLSLDPHNVEKAVTAFEGLGYKPRVPVPFRDLGDPETRRVWTEEKGALVFSLWSAASPALEVDLFLTLPFDFEEVWTRRVIVPLERTPVSVIALPDLLAMKRKAARPIDLDDVEALGGGHELEEPAPASYEGTRRRQGRLARDLSAGERARWLDETVEQLRRVQGRAKDSGR